MVGEVSDAAALAALKPDMTALAEWSDAARVTGTTVFASSGDSQSRIHVRSFAPAHGIPEDPCAAAATSASGCFSGRRDSSKDSEAPMWPVRACSSDAMASVSVRVHPNHIEIGGHAVTCVEGTLTPN